MIKLLNKNSRPFHLIIKKTAKSSIPILKIKSICLKMTFKLLKINSFFKIKLTLLFNFTKIIISDKSKMLTKHLLKNFMMKFLNYEEIKSSYQK